VVCSTNQGIATRAAAFPAMEIASADNIATSGTRVRSDDRLLTRMRLARSADPRPHLPAARLEGTVLGYR
jgi:hypothetical protein